MKGGPKHGKGGRVYRQSMWNAEWKLVILDHRLEGCAISSLLLLDLTGSNCMDRSTYEIIKGVDLKATLASIQQKNPIQVESIWM